jgi:undecaprenyl pyrophosphate phosphatase UppP
MFPIKDFKDLDVYSKSTIISIIVLMPFWYASLYLYNYDFYLKHDYYIQIVFTFCLSVIWYFMNFIAVIFNKALQNKEIDTSSSFKASGFLSVFVFAIIIVLEYEKKLSSYYNFLQHVYYYTIAAYILFTVIDYFSERKRKKKKKEVDSKVEEKSAFNNVSEIK